MRIGIDLQAIQTPDSRNRGIGRYSMDLAKAMIRVAGEHELVLLANEAFADSLGEIRAAAEEAPQPARFATYSLVDLGSVHGDERRAVQAVNDRLLAWHYSRLGLDALHVSSVFEGWVTGPAHVCARIGDLTTMATSATLYDLIPLLLRERYLSDQAAPFYFRNLAVLDQVDVVLAISESARRDANSALGIAAERVVNIRGAAGEQFRILDARDPAARVERLRRLGLRGPYIMYTGGIDYRKNIEGLIDAYARLPRAQQQGWQLAIVCAATAEQKQSVQDRARRAGIAEGAVVMTGFVSEEDLVELYNQCDLFVFPSLYEGFGLPILEAMKCGACVAASNRSSLPELVTDARALFDPDDPDDIAGVVSKLLENAELRREMADAGAARARGYTWESCARTALDAIVESARRKRATNAPVLTGRRPRVAFFTPLPDRRSGIADYSASLLPQLARHQDIDVLIDDYVPTDARAIAQLRVMPAAHFLPRRNRYDARVYHMGNSEFHAYMYDLALEYPGVLVMHDFYLSGLIHFIANRRGEPALFEREIVHSHGAAGEEAVRACRAGRRSVDSLIYEFPANRRLLERAQGLVFHSRYAAGLLTRFYPELWRLPVEVVPHFSRVVERDGAARPRTRQRHGIAPDTCLIGAFGYIAPTKQCDLLLEALEAPELAPRRFHLVLVGELAAGPYGTKVRELIRRSSHRDRITVTGYASEEDYQRWLGACDIYVSLRTLWRGESSGGLHRALGMGLACVVTDGGSFAELPRDVVLHVAPDSVPAVAAGIASLLDDAALRTRYAERAQRFAQEVLTPERVAEAYARATARIVAAAGAASVDALAEGLAIAGSDWNAPRDTLARAARIASAALLR